MLHSKNPEVLEYGKFLDGLSTKRRAQTYTISYNEKLLGPLKTAAQHLQPGQYKVDRDCVNDKLADLRKGRLTDSSSTQTIFFGCESRFDKSGTIKGMSGGTNALRTKNIGPGKYPIIDPLEQHQKWASRSSPAFSQRKGESQEDVRFQKTLNATMDMGPGKYAPPSFFDDVGRQREAADEKLRRRSKKCHWENQFGNVFRSIHASATQKRRSSAPAKQSESSH
eukprot:TRINITY_DN66903_c0_g1_i1.p1 TRINITY_DN66903_c0_g1~~TRINITY_DN66903_c0_g1_i1.p1  ORF type:complete len:224 (+),score=19.95 TRINITY_DN66903_c0_g1_i1:11-682(+)